MYPIHNNNYYLYIYLLMYNKRKNAIEIPKRCLIYIKQFKFDKQYYYLYNKKYKKQLYTIMEYTQY